MAYNLQNSGCGYAIIQNNSVGEMVKEMEIFGLQNK